MSKYYSKITKGFYSCPIQAKKFGCVEISDELHKQLMEGQVRGMEIVPDDKREGFPTLRERPLYIPTREELLKRLDGHLTQARKQGVSFGGNVFKSDSEAREMYRSFQDGVPSGFKLPDINGEPVPITSAKIKKLIAEIQKVDFFLMANYMKKVGLIEKAKQPHNLELSTGWIYQESEK